MTYIPKIGDTVEVKIARNSQQPPLEIEGKIEDLIKTPFGYDTTLEKGAIVKKSFKSRIKK